MTTITKAMKFDAIATYLEAEGADSFVIADTEVSKADLVDFLRHEVDLVNARNAHKSSKPSKKDVENEALMERICSELVGVDGGMTVSELSKAFNSEYSNQKLSALLTKLVKAGKVDKNYEKRIARFTLIG